MAALPDWMRPPRAEGWLAEDLDRLLASAARTVSDGFLPHSPDEEDSSFQPMLR